MADATLTETRMVDIELETVDDTADADDSVVYVTGDGTQAEGIWYSDSGGGYTRLADEDELGSGGDGGTSDLTDFSDGTTTISDVQTLTVSESGSSSVTLQDNGSGNGTLVISSTDTNTDTNTHHTITDGTTSVSDLGTLTVTGSEGATVSLTDNGSNDATLNISASSSGSDGTVAANDYHADSGGQLDNTGGENQAGYFGTFALDDQETIELYRLSVIDRTGGTSSALDTGLDVVIVEHTSSGDILADTLIQGDGSTSHADDSGTPSSPAYSYTNTSGGQQVLSLAIDNGHFGAGTGSTLDVSASAVGKIV